MKNAALLSSVDLPYQHFSSAQKQLANIEAIDYFLAKQFTPILIKPQSIETKISKTDVDLLFHVLVALSVSLREGHSCLPLKAIAGLRFAFLCDNKGIVLNQGFDFPQKASLIELFEKLPLAAAQEQAIVFDDENLYLRRYFLFERQILRFIEQQRDHLTNECHKHKTKGHNNAKIKQCIDVLFPKTAQVEGDIDWQKVAVANALNKPFSIIAGGPGTGKTYTVTKLLAGIVLMHDGKHENIVEPLKIALVAPTGKAAQRLSESIEQAKAGFSTLLPENILNKIPTQTQTIHRLLGVIANSPNFRHHQDNLLDCDILLIDEVSMVDLPLMARIFRALPKYCTVILLGDAQQLPSVAAGSILSDFTPLPIAQFSTNNQKYLTEVTEIPNLPQSKKQSVDYLTYLVKSRRFDGKGGIGLLSQAVIEGDKSKSLQLLQKAETGEIAQLMFHEGYNLAWLVSLIEQYYRPLAQVSSVSDAFTLLQNFRVLSATRKGETGVESLNDFIESTLKPNQFKQSNQPNLYHAKPIMISENDYSLGLFNGDIGLIWQEQSGHLMAFFEQGNGDYLKVLPSRLPHFETVYAMTIHKTQGSEFSHVALIMPHNTDNQLLTRELLYTGITRAKNLLTIQSSKPVWSQGVEGKVTRHSGIRAAF